MKKYILTLCVAILTVLALALGACAEGAFDGLEGVVILTPDEEQAGNAAPAVGEQSGLVLTLGDSSVEKAGETYANIIFDVSLMNWDLESYELANAVGAVLYYEDAYPFTGAFDFGTDTEIGMLVEETGKLTFSVPQIVALADIEALRLELTVLEDTYAEELTPFQLPDEFKEVSLPFDYGTRESDALELKLGEASVSEIYKGDKDEKYKWIFQEFSLINWSGEAQDVEESVSMLLAYAQKYGFEGTIEYGQEAIDPLEVVQCRAVFHVPNIVTEAGAGLLSLRIALNGGESEQNYDLSKSKALTVWDYLKQVYDYENPHAIDAFLNSPNETSHSAIEEWNGHLYMIVQIEGNHYFSWDRGVEISQLLGGHLATIESAEEQEFIQGLIEKYGKVKYYWLGGSREDGSWKWITTGEPIQNMYWESGEPNEGDHYYLWIDSNGLWGDIYSEHNDLDGFICEWEF